MCVPGLTSAVGSLSQFWLLTDPHLKFVPLGVELSGIDQLNCARSCLRNSSCYTFAFNDALHACTLGSWPVRSNTTTVHVNTFATHLCNPVAQFSLYQSGDVRLCVRASPGGDNFPNGQAACKAFGAIMYTTKTPEKMNLLKTIGKQYNDMFWVGLTDIETENVFKYTDDGSVLSDSWRKAIFGPGEPNGGTGDNCVYWDRTTTLLMDDTCSDGYRFLCEMPVLF
ncbi:C-type lectin domain family 4 member M-like [Physella acuta]|uniref:C-type lectin domain family 4 member M-like n=1 Tax=Physella acuta TaxID=109671 RepID=UPI0027DE5392|nr:C-type lectin domain family 4 member M-like [Physella acuta]